MLSTLRHLLRRVGVPALPFAMLFGIAQSNVEANTLETAIAKSVETCRSKEMQWKTEDLTIIEDTILQLTNRVRRERGLSSLIRSSALTLLARGQSKNMCRTKRLIHESEDFPEGWQLFTQRMKLVRINTGAENIAFRTPSANIRQWARDVVKGWLTSPPHRKNIFDPQWSYLGVGIAPCRDGRAYATQEFSMERGTLPTNLKNKTHP